MDRRSFLKWLGVGSAVGAAAPSVVSKMGPACVADHDDWKTTDQLILEELRAT